jgi:hypothetical protein
VYSGVIRPSDTRFDQAKCICVSAWGVARNRPVQCTCNSEATALALQETLTALGCSGNSLGPLISGARKRGLLAPHDAKFDQAISNIMEWVSSDRSQSGEAHHVSDATYEDAWLIVHVVGAHILRLASGPPRGTST